MTTYFFTRIFVPWFFCTFDNDLSFLYFKQMEFFQLICQLKIVFNSQIRVRVRRSHITLQIEMARDCLHRY